MVLAALIVSFAGCGDSTNCFERSVASDRVMPLAARAIGERCGVRLRDRTDAWYNLRREYSRPRKRRDSMATVAPERPEILSEPEGLYEVIDGRVVEKPMGVYEVLVGGSRSANC